MSFVVYTVLDADRKCLYVGQTSDVTRRMKEHRAISWWARQPGVTVLTIEFATRAEALEAEFWRIQKFRPLHNILHNPRHVTVEEEIWNRDFEEFYGLREPTARDRKRDALALLRAQNAQPGAPDSGWHTAAARVDGARVAAPGGSA